MMKKTALALALLATPAFACSVPVFRYALEHWAADPYQVEITHKDPLSTEQQAWVKQLSDSKQSSNLAVTVKAVPTSAGSDAGPRLTVKHSASLSEPREVWSAPLTAETVTSLLDSPLRQEIVTKLGEGDSAVWILLESGDKTKDDAAAQVLEQQLTRLAETMELPKLDEQDIKNGLVSVPDEGLRLSFPLLRLDRQNPSEQFLVHLLLATEPDLQDVLEPIAFPVFGRGRVLYALVGKGIKADNLGRAASFLVGSCSCQVKEQNPGVDLLLTADWKKLLNTNALLDEELPKLSDIEGLKPILVEIPERKNDTVFVSFSYTSFIPHWITGTALAIGVLLWVVWKRSQRRAP